jgi:hypothetical protein
MGYLIDSRQERAFVCFRWLMKPTDLSNELKGRVPNLCFRGLRVEIEEGSDIPAHSQSLKGLSELAAF